MKILSSALKFAYIVIVFGKQSSWVFSPVRIYLSKSQWKYQTQNPKLYNKIGQTDQPVFISGYRSQILNPDFILKSILLESNQHNENCLVWQLDITKIESLKLEFGVYQSSVNWNRGIIVSYLASRRPLKDWFSMESFLVREGWAQSFQKVNA